MIAIAIDPSVLAAIITSAGAAFIAIIVSALSLRAQHEAASVAAEAKQTIGEIKVSVDGRLEATYTKVDELAGIIAKLTGTAPPPAVAGLSRPGIILTPEQVLGEAAEKAKGVLGEARAAAKGVLGEAVAAAPTSGTPAAILLADAATRAKEVLDTAAARAREILGEADAAAAAKTAAIDPRVSPLTPGAPTTQDVHGVEVPIVEAPVIVVMPAPAADAPPEQPAP